MNTPSLLDADFTSETLAEHIQPEGPASSMQATVFGVQRIAPAPASGHVAVPSPAAAPGRAQVVQHMAPAARPSVAAPPPPPRQAAPPPPSGLSAAAAALADQPTGFLVLPESVRAAGRASSGMAPAQPAASAGVDPWLADQPTSWVQLQPNPAEGAAPAHGQSAAAASAGAMAPAMLRPQAASGSSTLRPWLLSLGIGLLGGLVGLALILSSIRFLSGNKGQPVVVESRRTAGDATARPSTSSARGAPPLSPQILDDALRAISRGDTDRAIDILQRARGGSSDPTLDLEALIDALKRQRATRLH